MTNRDILGNSATAGHHPNWPGLGSYLTLLITLLFTGVCGAVWINNEAMAVWLLSEGAVQESTTRTLPGTIKSWAMASGISGLVTAQLVLLWSVFGITPWAPAQGLVTQAWKAVGPGVDSLRAFAIAFLLATLRVSASLLRPVGSGFTAIARATGLALWYWRQGLSATLRYVGAAALKGAQAGDLVLALVISFIGYIIGFIGYPLVLAAIAVARAVGLAMGQVALRIATVLAYLKRVMLAVAHAVGSTLCHLRQVITPVLSHLWRGLVWVLGHLRLWVAEVFCYVKRGLALVLRHTWLAASTPVAYAGRGLVLGLDYLHMGVSRALRYLWAGVSTVVRVLGLALRFVGAGIRRALGYLVGALTVALRYTWLAVSTPLVYAWRGLSFSLHYLQLWAATAFRYVERGAALALRYTWPAVSTPVVYAWRGLVFSLGYLRMGAATFIEHVGRALRVGLHYIRLGVSASFSYACSGLVSGLVYFWAPVFSALHYLAAAVSAMALPVGLVLGLVGSGVLKALGYLGMGVITVLGLLKLAAYAVARTVALALRPLRMGVWTIAQAADVVLRGLYQAVSIALGSLWMGLSTIALLLAATWRGLLSRVAVALRGAYRGAVFAVRTVKTGFGAVPDVGKTAVWVAQHRKGVSAMSDLSLTRQRVLSLIATLWLFAILGSMLAWTLWPAPPEPTVRVVHWATGHLMREAGDLRLLPVMAKQFNEAGHRTESDKRIVVEVHNVPSELQAKYLVTRVTSGRRIDLHDITDGYVDRKTSDSDPAIVTPSSAHWLVTTNYEVGHAVVDLSAAQSIVGPVIGIVTYEEMARCLGWPDKEIGYADIIALRNDPLGWESYPCAKGEWGQRPLVAFTDPTTSSTGRSLLLALYSFASGKSPQQLTADDVRNPEVVSYVEQFQGLIDHYLIGTTVLNTKIYQGPRYGHFFIMPEDNLIHLYKGTERAFIGGVKKKAPPISERMVMIYPKEGSMPRNNCACIVQADWVTGEQVEAAQRWIDFLLEDEQQRSFMAAGFRPATDLPLTDPISDDYGLDPTKPRKVLNPSLIKPEVAAAIDQSWELVKRPGIVTFVVDTSGSMMGDKINQARDGLSRALENMARNNQVGLVTFNDGVNTRIPVAPLAQNRFAIADAIYDVRAGGETALYDAIRAGIEMTDAAEGEKTAIRAVVVLTDGRANQGQTGLDDLIRMESRREEKIRRFRGLENDEWAVKADGGSVDKAEVVGRGLAMDTHHPVQIFYIGIGDDADTDVGRILAEATGAEFQGVTEDDLANVLEEFSKYF